MEPSAFQTSFYFKLSFQGIEDNSDASFQEASGLSKEFTLEEIPSGGENRFKYRVPTASSFQNLVLKRGVALQNSPLIEWCAQTLDNGLEKPIITRNIELALLDANGNTSNSWTFVNAYPVKWRASDLNSQENKLLIESIEFAYHYFDIATAR